jgi:hypothetical protein
MVFRTLFLPLALLLHFLPLPAHGANASLLGAWVSEGAALPRIELEMRDGILLLRGWQQGPEGMEEIGMAAAEPLAEAGPESFRAQLPLREGIGSLTARFSEETLWVELASPLAPGMKATYAYRREAPAARGSISGRVIGLARSTASIFHLYLYGPNDPNTLYSSQSFGKEKAYAFHDLPDGDYWIRVESQAVTAIQAVPSRAEMKIRGGQPVVMDVELK